MRVGGMRRRADAQQNRPAARTGYGGAPAPNWVTVATIWVQVDNVPRESEEIEYAQEQQAVRLFNVRTRYRALDAGMRLSLRSDGRLLAIDSVMDVGERHRELLLKCYEVAS